MNDEKIQRDWGWLIVLYVFLAGLGGGTFLFSFVLIWLDKLSAQAHIGAVAGPLLVLCGSLMLIFDLGSPTRIYRLFTTPATVLSSWMVRGAWILTAFIIVGLAYALPAFGPFSSLPWNQESALGQALGVIGAVLAIMVTIYPGLLLGVIKSIPLWNTSALPPLFLLSGLDTGLAALLLISLSSSVADARGFHLLGIMDVSLILLLLVALGAYVEIVRQSGTTAAASIRRLVSPLFVIGVVVTGLLAPLVLLSVGISASSVTVACLLDGVAAILILLGGLLLRYAVVTSGLRIEVR
jgi:formate-dependent nitrite reductase membrane component NrfD